MRLLKLGDCSLHQFEFVQDPGSREQTIGPVHAVKVARDFGEEFGTPQRWPATSRPHQLR